MSNKDPSNSMPWLFPNLENYSHLLLNLNFKAKSDLEPKLGSKSFFLKIATEGFEGLLFYIYKSSNSLVFNVLKNPQEMTHTLQIQLTNKYYNLNENFYFCILPFGYLKVENSFKFSVEVNNFDVIKQLFAWSPSFLFKNIKSIIKINNTYQEVYPKFSYPLTVFHLENWFKSNEKRLIFDFINMLARIESMDLPGIKLKPKDIKNMINQTNEYLFESSDQEEYEDPSFILTELKRLRNNVDVLPKSKIINWLNDIIEYYSNQLQQKPL